MHIYTLAIACDTTCTCIKYVNEYENSRGDLR